LNSSSAPFVPALSVAASIAQQGILFEQMGFAQPAQFAQPTESATRGPIRRKKKQRNQAVACTSHEAVKQKSKDNKTQPLHKREVVHAKVITTFLVRNIVCRYSELDIMDILDKTDLANKYDFVYVPKGCDRLANMGYFFLNLKAPDYVHECMAVLSGKVFGDRPTTKRCEVSTAEFQGAELIAHLVKKDKRALANLRWCAGCGTEAEMKSSSTLASEGLATGEWLAKTEDDDSWYDACNAMPLAKNRSVANARKDTKTGRNKIGGYR
jgi:hypothetical protein